MEASLTNELIVQESKDRSRVRRSAGNSPVALRSRSQVFDCMQVDNTMTTELEYLNMLPNNLSQIDESSFLKGMQNTTLFKTQSAEHGISSQVASEQSERIKQLEDQLKQHQAQITELEEEKTSRGASDTASNTNTAHSGTDRGPESAAQKEMSGNEDNLLKQTQDQKKELTILREQIRIQKKENELEMLNIKQAQAEELKRM